MILGTGTRLAMRMGYHRDPRHLAKVSPFEGEMRRRTFMVVETLDLLLSTQAGLPPVIHEDEFDTEPPSNLLDTDFDEDCQVLPPSRPPSDPTPMLYYCFKGRLARSLRRVIQHALSLKRRSYDETMRLDAELREMYKDTPPSLRMKPLKSSIMDDSYTIMSRLNISLMYLRSLCILHRGYINYDRSNPTFEYSRKSCTDAALQIMDYQAELHFACQPGGQFCNDKWMLSSLQLHDFLVAAMIVCLDLYEFHNKSSRSDPEELNTQAREYDILQVSRGIWESRTSISRDARRASKILAVMLARVPRPKTSSTLSIDSKPTTSLPQSVMNGNTPMDTSDSPSATSQSYTNGFAISEQEQPFDMLALSDLNTSDPLNTIFSASDNLDWVSIQYC